MRINKFVALATGMSRRAADLAIRSGKVRLNGEHATLGSEVRLEDKVFLDGQELALSKNFTTILLNKPAGYVCSRDGQGSKTIYDLLPEKYHRLKPIGRLDKDSSGLIILTDDGELANKLTHPRYQKEKLYEVKLNKSLKPADEKQLLTGVELSDGPSKFLNLKRCSDETYQVALGEGRNRQIRRTFNALGYKIASLKRLRLGDFALENLAPGKTKEVKTTD